MLDAQLEGFESSDRWVAVLLGCLSLGRRLEVLCALPRSDGRLNADGPLVDSLLGVISASRTLRSVALAEGVVAPRESHEPSAPATLSPVVLSLR
jgi:hypothetical protein